MTISYKPPEYAMLGDDTFVYWKRIYSPKHVGIVLNKANFPKLNEFRMYAIYNFGIIHGINCINSFQMNRHSAKIEGE